MKLKLALYTTLLIACISSPAFAYKPGPKQFIQGYYKYLYETYKPEFAFSKTQPVAAAGAVAYIFLSGHRSEFQGNELSSPIIRRSIQTVKSAQAKDGSFGSNDQSGTDRVYPTVAAVLALISAQNSDYEASIASAQNWLTKQKTPGLDTMGKLLILIGIHGETVNEANASDFLKLVSDLEPSATPEARALHQLGSALMRNFLDKGGKLSDPAIEKLPSWGDLSSSASVTLAECQNSSNVPAACIAVRTLHHCMNANKRKR